MRKPDAAKWLGEKGDMVLVGLAPTEAEIAEARGRVAAGQDYDEVWAEIDARIAKRLAQRKRETK